MSDGTVLDFGTETVGSDMDAARVWSTLNLAWNHVAQAGLEAVSIEGVTVADDCIRLRLCENAASLHTGEKSTSQIGSGSTIARAPMLSRPRKQPARRVFTRPQPGAVSDGWLLSDRLTELS